MTKILMSVWVVRTIHEIFNKVRRIVTGSEVVMSGPNCDITGVTAGIT